MQSLTQHINYLLFTHRKVYIEGIGTFYTYYEGASFDAIESIFYPLKIRIKLHNGELRGAINLEKSLIRQSKYQKDKIPQLIESFIDDILNTLEKRKFYRLDGLGYLVKDSKDRINFRDTFWKKRKEVFLKPMRV